MTPILSNMIDLTVRLAGIELANPIIAAAGTSGYVREIADVLDPRDLGAITTKSITREPREGHPAWRLVDLERGMLNAVGLANVGLERFIAEKLPEAEKLETVLIGSIAGNSIEDYVAVAEAFDGCAELPLVELNVSCPNTADGREFGASAQSMRPLLDAVRPALGGTRMFVKLSPDVGRIEPIVEAAIEAGADGLTVMNTVSAMAIDVETRRSRLGRGPTAGGGMSGPAVHPIAVRLVHEAYQVAGPANIPIIGVGGVMTWRDAAELILAGATAVGVGTALFVDTRCPRAITGGLRKWVQRQGCRRIEELTGRLGS